MLVDAYDQKLNNVKLSTRWSPGIVRNALHCILHKSCLEKHCHFIESISLSYLYQQGTADIRIIPVRGYNIRASLDT